SGNQRRPAKRFAIGPNERAMARNGPLWRGRPATKSEAVVVFMGGFCDRRRPLRFPATGQWRLTESRDARSGDPVADGPGGRIGAPARIDLAVQVGDVALHRVDRDLQARRDLAVALAVREQVEDLDLAWCQRAGATRSPAPERRRGDRM